MSVDHASFRVVLNLSQALDQKGPPIPTKNLSAKEHDHVDQSQNQRLNGTQGPWERVCRKEHVRRTENSGAFGEMSAIIGLTDNQCTTMQNAKNTHVVFFLNLAVLITSFWKIKNQEESQLVYCFSGTGTVVLQSNTNKFEL